MPQTLSPILERPAVAKARAPRPLTVAIVGATGAVGAELIACLERRAFPVGELRLLASPRSAGRTLTFQGAPVTVQALDEASFEGVDVAFFSAGASLSRRYGPVAVAAGAWVVDNSSAFRMDADTPLVVPEVNAWRLGEAPGRLVANPNCVAAIAAVVLAPLHARRLIVRLVGSTYQAASGAGAAAMAELRDSTAAALAGEAYRPQVLAHPYAFNLFSHDAEVDPETGYNGEELKVMAELRKLLAAPDLPASFTCIRVPVLRAHAMALTVRFAEPVSVEEARAWLSEAAGVRVVDDREANHFPMPGEASGADDVLVGRIRTDLSDPSGRSLSLFIAGDQLLKGAALNAVQIAEALVAAGEV
ncbi:aspartate-semialdehyde dehydrogenase [Phenylobacterium sp.]|uniref:aspartate-semialdehyde dehydrogenase n=1 Tax=Phenylobacterium sp. TaxID=1871053 RepID=UPI00272F9C2B|nr:aspartate-semialdehyde dehydrogenase [Phenylobacterium sp.]MDP1615754.1 aspartate-semialdehyde dehydrogenase [Phenylobacterium sp.]MDP1988223.1 aspartate-semialdehyde dehydrogenase [Phenylobacterium sp.]